MRSFDEFLAKTLCSGGDGGGGGDGGFAAASDLKETDFDNHHQDSTAGNARGAGAYNDSFGPGSVGSETADDYMHFLESHQYNPSPTFDDGGRSRSGELGFGPYSYQSNQMGFGPSFGRGLANAFTGFVGMHNPGPSYHSLGIMESPGFQFNPGALAGSYAGLGLGVPGLGALGAQAYNSLNSTQRQTNETPTASERTYPQYEDPYDITLNERLRAAGINV